MELVLLFLLIVFSIATSSGKNRKKADREKGSDRQRAKENKAQQSRRNKNAQRAAAKKKQPDPSVRPREAKMHGEGDDPCHEDMLGPRYESIHYEDADLGTAGEGEDPCHPGSAHGVLESEMSAEHAEPRERPQAFFSPEDVRGGIIMSEILTRPRDRRGTGHRRTGGGYGKYTGTDRR